MIFAAPGALLLLFAAPLLVLLEAARRSSAPRVVSSLALWRGLLASPAPGSRLERLRLDAGAWLRVLAVCAAAFGLAAPSLPSGRGGAPLRLVLDRSASMGARTKIGGTRIESAIAKALAALDRLPPGAPVRFEQPPCGGEPVLTDVAGARTLLHRARPTDAPLDARALFSEEGGEEDALLVTDHVPEGLPPGVRVLAAGEEAENAGFVAFEAKREGRVRLWALLRNFSRLPIEREARAFGANALSLGIVRLAPGASRAIAAEVEPGAEGVVGLRLEGGDDLAADDRVAAVAGSLTLRVFLGPDVPDPVARAIASVEGVEATLGTEEGAGGLPFDLRLGRDPGGDVPFRIALDVAEGEPFEASGMRFAPGSPLPDGLSLAGVSPGPVRAAAEGSGDPLLLARASEGPERPIAVADESGWRLHFDPSAGNWKEHASFPVFFAVAAEQARKRAGRFGFVSTGEQVRGGCADRAGLYPPSGPPITAANLLSPEESALPHAVSEATPASSGRARSRPRPLAGALLSMAAAAALLSVLRARNPR